MATAFEAELARARGDIGAAAAEVLGTLRQMSEADLDKAPRGEWPARQVIHHLIQSAWSYARSVDGLRDQQTVVPARPTPPATRADAIAGFQAARAALDRALEGVPEETFYRLKDLGHQDYSVRSVLSEVALHERQHLEQVRDCLRA